MVGMENTISTSLSNINNDRFETINFKNKMLVSVSNSETFKRNVVQLKRLTGGDQIRGRIKLTQGSFDFNFNGLVLITANEPLQVSDTSGALERRIRYFEAPNRIQDSNIKTLLHPTREGGWSVVKRTFRYLHVGNGIESPNSEKNNH